MSANKGFSNNQLEEYRSKRTRATTEPFETDFLEKPGLFVIQKHAARSLHYDLRLEFGGILLSWAVPKGPSLDPAEKRFAVQTEDHPIEYADFEGQIPAGNYGAGSMIVWDRGRWIALEDPVEGMEKGKLLFELKGYKLGGVWTLVRTRSEKGREWLLIKKPDRWADPEGKQVLGEESVLSGLTVQEIGTTLEKPRKIHELLEAGRSEKRKISLESIELMLARRREDPFDRKGWVFELKYDGYRMLAARRSDRIQLRYRSGRDATQAFPELTRALAALPYMDFTLDGEVVVLDPSGKPNFQMLQQRALRSQPIEVERASVELPVTLFCFDLLTFGEYDLRALPLIDRKQILRLMLPHVGPIRFSEHFDGIGVKLFNQVVELGLEGIVAKREGSKYRGGRHSDWLKIPALLRGDFVVVGFTKPKGSRSHFGALHLAGYDRQGELTYAGRVGTGFSDSDLEKIHSKLVPLLAHETTCSGLAPKGPEHSWVMPRIVSEIRFKEWTEKGLLRQPSFVSLKQDALLTDCLLPQLIDYEHSSPPAPQTSGGPGLRFTNLDKSLWPEEGYSKGDLISYYRRVGPWILPYLRDRLLVMDRYPDGIAGKSFFQKNVPGETPEWIRTEQLWVDEKTRANNYMVCDNLETLLYIANLASIPLHIWASRVEKLKQPDWCILDLDPPDSGFSSAVEVAFEIRSICNRVGIETCLKTSGSKGLHILIPMGARFSFEQTRLLGELIARFAVMRIPDLATVERRVEQRAGKVYIDSLQNGYGKLLVAPYCVRPREAAPVSMPLHWEELAPDLDPTIFNITTVPSRVEGQDSDPLLPLLGEGINLPSVLAALETEFTHIT